ncbi:MAG: 16S rRNA (cytidine(1402)-2'-O)-methyltransferase [Chlamydiota bacterium]
MLYLVATPIGNLGDFSFRAIETLKTCDYILCEDTRHSRILLQHYSIDIPLYSFDKFKEAQKEERVIGDLQEGKNVALISDAGTPLISDPGEALVKRCRELNLEVTAIPGASAVTTALILSGLPAAPFQFIGFLPKKQQELQHTLSRALFYRGTTICYESPHRIVETLTELQKLSPSTPLCIARELTKQYEECLSGTAQELLEHFEKHPPRGEMVLLLAPLPPAHPFEEWDLKQLVAHLQDELSLSKSEAIKLAAEFHHIPKRQVYKEFFNTEEN